MAVYSGHSYSCYNRVNFKSKLPGPKQYSLITETTASLADVASIEE